LILPLGALVFTDSADYRLTTRNRTDGSASSQHIQDDRTSKI